MTDKSHLFLFFKEVPLKITKYYLFLIEVNNDQKISEDITPE